MYYVGRYAYSSEDASEDFDKDDTLKLIKPSQPSFRDATKPEAISVISNGSTAMDDEEEKTA